MAGPSLYLDEDVRVLLAEVLRSRGYQATHVLEVKRTGKSDAEQLAYAAKNGMAVLTHNIRDYTNSAIKSMGLKVVRSKEPVHTN